MKRVKVPRWECDFCKRKKTNKKYMELHEQMCFKNPNRVCNCGKTVDSYKEPVDTDCNACKVYEMYLHPELNDSDF